MKIFLFRVWAFFVILFEIIKDILTPFERRRKEQARLKWDEEYKQRQQEENEKLALLPSADWFLEDIRAVMLSEVKEHMDMYYSPYTPQKLKDGGATDEEIDEWISHFAIIDEYFEESRKIWRLDKSGVQELSPKEFDQIWNSYKNKPYIFSFFYFYSYNVRWDLKHVRVNYGDMSDGTKVFTKDISRIDGTVTAHN